MTDAVEAVSLLGEPVRRRLYDYVIGQADAVSREQAATAVGIKRPLAAFHLDKLAEEGLLEVEFRRLSEKKGPGAGRPAKLYKRSSQELSVSLPHREYELAARVFAEALTTEDSSAPVRDAARRVDEPGDARQAAHASRLHYSRGDAQRVCHRPQPGKCGGGGHRGLDADVGAR